MYRRRTVSAHWRPSLLDQAIEAGNGWDCVRHEGPRISCCGGRQVGGETESGRWTSCFGVTRGTTGLAHVEPPMVPRLGPFVPNNLAAVTMSGPALHAIGHARGIRQFGCRLQPICPVVKRPGGPYGRQAPTPRDPDRREGSFVTGNALPRGRQSEPTAQSDLTVHRPRGRQPEPAAQGNFAGGGKAESRRPGGCGRRPLSRCSWQTPIST